MAIYNAVDDRKFCRAAYRYLHEFTLSAPTCRYTYIICHAITYVYTLKAYIYVISIEQIDKPSLQPRQRMCEIFLIPLGILINLILLSGCSPFNYF